MGFKNQLFFQSEKILRMCDRLLKEWYPLPLVQSPGVSNPQGAGGLHFLGATPGTRLGGNKIFIFILLLSFLTSFESNEYNTRTKYSKLKKKLMAFLANVLLTQKKTHTHTQYFAICENKKEV